LTDSKQIIRYTYQWMKNIIFNKTESFVWRNTSNHACQIFCSKSNCETMYHWFFLLEITMVKIINNLNVCSSHSYLYQCRFNGIVFLMFTFYSRSEHMTYHLLWRLCCKDAKYTAWSLSLCQFMTNILAQSFHYMFLVLN
jgi:hypothetical protein